MTSGGINNFEHEDVLIRLKSNVPTTDDMKVIKHRINFYCQKIREGDGWEGRRMSRMGGKEWKY